MDQSKSHEAVLEDGHFQFLGRNSFCTTAAAEFFHTRAFYKVLCNPGAALLALRLSSVSGTERRSPAE